MSADKINQLFWLNYAKQIKLKAGIQGLGESAAFFLASEAQKGPLAGSTIPDEYTNEGLYQMANNLLAVDNLFYAPSALHGYAQALQTFLAWVDVGRKGGQELDVALYNALQDMTAAEQAISRERVKAYERYEQESKMGLVSSEINFAQWINYGNAPGYTAAKESYDAKVGVVSDIQTMIDGELAALVTQDRNKVKAGVDSLTDTPGFNMRAAQSNALSPAELVRRLKSSEKIPPPPFHLRPLYMSPQYKNLVEKAESKLGTKYEPQNSIEFTINTGEDTSQFDFGQTQVGGSFSFTYAPWFSFNAGGSHSTESRSLKTGNESEEARIKIVYDDIQIVPINPGSWNIDVSKYKLREDAPKAVKTLARVSSLVVATGLGYEITVGAQTANEIDTRVKEATSAGGSVSIFGIPIGLNASGSHSEEHTSHTGTWDRASATFTVAPKLEARHATVLGVLGEKFGILTA